MIDKPANPVAHQFHSEEFFYLQIDSFVLCEQGTVTPKIFRSHLDIELYLAANFESFAGCLADGCTPETLPSLQVLSCTQTVVRPIKGINMSLVEGAKEKFRVAAVA